ncbi:hypothetical protein [Streptomyces anthocyanicus]
MADQAPELKAAYQRLETAIDEVAADGGEDAVKAALAKYRKDHGTTPPP